MMVLVVMLCWYSWVALVAGYAGGHIGRMHTDVRTGMGMGMGMGTHAHTHSHTALHMNLKPTTRKDDNGRRLDLNWRAGLCKHRVAFEASDTIRRLRFTGDLCAFGLLDGRLCVVRMSSGEIVARFKNHSHEITALDFDGRELVSGSAAGRTVVYESLEGWGEGREGGEGEGGDGYGDGDGESGESGERGGKGKTFGGVKFKFRHHSRAVTGARIVTVDGVGGVRGDKVKGVEGEGDMVEGGEGERGAGENGQQERGEGVQGAQGVQGFSGGSRGIIGRRKILITCGMDKMLVAVDMTSGLLLYKVTLPAAPLCMDAQGSGTGRYIALGLINGLVLFVNAQTGQTILSFQAHSNRVRSLHFSADQVLLTGSNKGVVKRWDLSGDPGEPGNPGEEEEEQGEEGEGGSEGGGEGWEGPFASGLTAEQGNQQENLDTDCRRPTRFVDFYFQGAIDRKKSFKRPARYGSPRLGVASAVGGVAQRLLAKQRGIVTLGDIARKARELGNADRELGNAVGTGAGVEVNGGTGAGTPFPTVRYSTMEAEGALAEEATRATEGGEAAEAEAEAEATGAQEAGAGTERTGTAGKVEAGGVEAGIAGVVGGGVVEGSRGGVKSTNIWGDRGDRGDKVGRPPPSLKELAWELDDPSPQDRRVQHYYRDDLEGDVPVVALQGDGDKVVAAFEDGTLVCWDAHSQELNFELQGRSNLVSSLQYSDSKLLADGTSSVLVVHDFDDPPAVPEDLAYDLGGGD